MLMQEYSVEFVDAIRESRNVPCAVAGFKVVDSFSFAGSRRATNGSKVKATIELNGELITVAGTIPMTGNGRDVFTGYELDSFGQKVSRTFWASELWASVMEKTDSKNLSISFSPVWDGNAFQFTIVYTGKNKRARNGVETATLIGTLSATDSLILARAMALGVGYVVDQAQFDALMAMRVAEDVAAKKAA